MYIIMEKTFDQFTDNDWLEFKHYVKMNTQIYDEILITVNHKVHLKYLDVNKPYEGFNNEEWTLNYSIENIYPSLYIIAPSIKIDNLHCNKSICQTLSNGIKISIDAAVIQNKNFENNTFGNRKFLKAFEDISLNICIDFSNLTHDNSDKHIFENFNYNDYYTLYYICSLFYIDYDIKKEIYVEFQNIIDNLYKYLQNSYNDLWNTIEHELHDYMNLFDLPNQKLKDYMIEMFDWKVNFSDLNGKVFYIRT